MDRNHGLTKTDTLGQQFLDRPGTPQIGRQDRRGEPQRRSIRGIRRENRPPDGFLVRLTLEPDLDGFALRGLRDRRRYRRAEVFLKASCACGSVLGCCGRTESLR